jgi:hypothetical protein
MTVALGLYGGVPPPLLFIQAAHEKVDLMVDVFIWMMGVASTDSAFTSMYFCTWHAHPF